MAPKTSSIVLDGTNSVTIQTGDLAAIEVIPDGSVTVEVTLGDGNDPFTLQSGASYASPSNIALGPMRVTFSAASATSLSVVQWPR